jgi:dienelactone hydrolase
MLKLKIYIPISLVTISIHATCLFYFSNLLYSCSNISFTAGLDSTMEGTQQLTMRGDLSAQMVEGIDRFLMHEIEVSVNQRDELWQRDFSSWEHYEKSIDVNRERFRKCIGAVDWNGEETTLESMINLDTPQNQEKSALYTITPVRWRVLEGVYGEGLLLRPIRSPKAYVIAIPDADQTPEKLSGLHPGIPPESQFARRLAEQGCEVLVPVLINREDDYSGNPKVNRSTNQPHREWIYRMSFEMGRHIIGHEVQKILSAVEYFAKQDGSRGRRKIGIIGYGEGGLIGLYSAALHRDVAVTVIGGYFGPRERIWEEPIYRNIFGLLREFGDAEIASLIAPRRLIVEFSSAPMVDNTYALRENQKSTPGRIGTPELTAVDSEVKRANELIDKLTGAPPVALVKGIDSLPVALGSENSLLLLLDGLGVKIKRLVVAKKPETFQVTDAQVVSRQYRQVKELEKFTQQLLYDSDRVRNALTLDRLDDSPQKSSEVLKQNRELLWKEIIGQILRPNLPLNPRTRLIYNQDRWTGYEVVLDVLPEVFAWGYLLVPKDIKPGERRPVVVCQHGLESLPEDVVNQAGFAARLADQGFVVYAPHNPYRGRDKFRMLQRKANPLGKSLFSVIIAQHDATLDWLESLPFVDPARIGFYGISYGGKTAMRVPAVLERYCLSICSADFNDWVRKNVTVDSPYSYVFSHEWEMPEWNLGNTFNYAEMASLIAPRPFMVERGHFDKVAPDWWVAYEYAKVRLIYLKLNVHDRTEIEFFNGGHKINGVGSFQFLHKYLNWPEPK